MIIVALGANLPGSHGAPEQALQAALKAMESYGITIEAASRTWLTEPVPVSSSPWYRNAVAVVSTSLPPRQLLDVMRQIEQNFGRDHDAERNSPRVLDLDLIAYHDEIINDPELTVPHPRMDTRAFVLLPLQEIAPHWRHPRLETSLAELIKQIPPGQKAGLLENAL